MDIDEIDNLEDAKHFLRKLEYRVWETENNFYELLLRVRELEAMTTDDGK